MSLKIKLAYAMAFNRYSLVLNNPDLAEQFDSAVQGYCAEEPEQYNAHTIYEKPWKVMERYLCR